MRNRVFLKAMAAFVVVIAVATLTLDFSIRRTWESSLHNDIEKLLVQNAEGFAPVSYTHLTLPTNREV